MTTPSADPAADNPATDATERSSEYFDAGLNCSESVLRAVNDAYDLGLPPSAYGIATPFGGGFGGARSTCGALTGGLMALGLAHGRSGPSQSAQPGSMAGRALHDRFLAQFQSVSCRELTAGFDWDKPERRQACQAYVRFAAQAVASILEAPPAAE